MRNSWNAIKKAKIYFKSKYENRTQKQRFAEKLNREMTKAEWALWYHLRNHGFKAQQIICGFIPDFVNRHRQLIVEVDGSVHDGAEQRAYDSRREDILRREGFCVVRFTNRQVLSDVNSCLLRLGLVKEKKRMAFPKTLDELRTTGYKHTGLANCRACGEPIEWWETPKAKRIPMNHGTAVPHWSTCPNADDFRKPKAGRSTFEANRE